MDGENHSLDHLEMESNLPSQVTTIRAKLLDEHGLSIPNHCDEFICRCLRLKDGNTEKAVNLIKSFYAMTLDIVEWDTPLLPSLFEDYYKIGTVEPMQKRDSLGRFILICRFAKWNPEEMTYDKLLAGLWMLTQYINAEFIDVQRLGYVLVVDCSQFSLKQAWAVKPIRLIAMLRWIKNVINGRVKGIHPIFCPKIARVIYNAITPFLKEKIKKRIMFHDDLESLHKQIAPECLPTSLGGHLKEGEGVDEVMIKDLISKDEFFKDIIKNRFPDK